MMNPKELWQQFARKLIIILGTLVLLILPIVIMNTTNIIQAIKVNKPLWSDDISGFLGRIRQRLTVKRSSRPVEQKKDLNVELCSAFRELAVREYDFQKSIDLLNAGANPNAPCDATSPINKACYPCFMNELGGGSAKNPEGYRKLVELLVKRGLNLKAHDWRGYNFLTLAADRVSVKTMEVFLQSGANVNETDKNGNTPLSAAVLTNYGFGQPRLQMVTFLLAHGADPNFILRYRKTPIHLAAKGDMDDSTPILEALLNNGGKTGLKNQFGADEWVDAYCSDRYSASGNLKVLGGPKKNKISAQDLNTIGYRAYKVGDYQDASFYFGCATKKDEQFALAHYNLACTWALMNKNRSPEDGPFNPSYILTHLKKSIELDPARKDRTLIDPDLKPIHNTVFFKMLSGTIDLTKTNDVDALRKSGAWRSSNQCGNSYWDDQLIFEPSGRVRAGCGNYCSDENDSCIIADKFVVNGSDISLTNPRGKIKKLKLYFDGIEAHIKAINADESVENVWHEFSGFHGGP